MYSKLIAERRQALKHKAQEALQETQRLRMVLASWRRRPADKTRVEQMLRSWGWDGLKVRMSGCSFSSYVGIPLQAEIYLPSDLERSWKRDNSLGLGPEFVQALIAEATLDGARALIRFYNVIRANALYSSVARRAFTTWAADQVLAFEHTASYRPLDPNAWTPPGSARTLIPAFYPYAFRPRYVWDVRTRIWIFDHLWWPQQCHEPFWAALCNRDAVPMMQARFEPERFWQRRVATRGEPAH